MSAFAPKNERYEKHRRRAVPIVPKPMAILQDAFDAAEEGQKRVVSLSRNNLHRGNAIDPWKDLFQALRRSCDTELKQTYSTYAVDAWLGHSRQVSENHYLMIPDDLWDRVAGKSTAKSTAASSRTDSQGAASGQDDKDVSYHETPINRGSNADLATSGARGRTGDLGFMNPTL